MKWFQQYIYIYIYSLFPSSDILPLPSEIKCMFTDNSENTVIDDPKKFDGKIRSFPHERGVWATYVYIEC